jgi:AraC family transcriptional regulator
MDEQQIRITKNHQADTLGGDRALGSQRMATWTGLRIARYATPAEVVDRHVVAPHPILTHVCQGRLQSHIRFGFQDVRHRLRADDLMLYGGGTEIAYAHWQSQDAVLMSVELDPARLALLDAGDTRFAQRTLAGQPRFADTELSALMHEMWREAEDGCPRGRLFADSLGLGLAVHLHRRFGRPDPGRGDARARLSVAQLRRIDDYIAEHLDQPIGLADLAGEIGLSRFHFTRLFSHTTGQSPYQHLIRKRLERAYQLLRGSELSVADVALSTGFSSQAHFSGLCRRELGATPRDLREQGLARS